MLTVGLPLPSGKVAQVHPGWSALMECGGGTLQGVCMQLASAGLRTTPATLRRWFRDGVPARRRPALDAALQQLGVAVSPALILSGGSPPRPVQLRGAMFELTLPGYPLWSARVAGLFALSGLLGRSEASLLRLCRLRGDAWTVRPREFAPELRSTLPAFARELARPPRLLVTVVR